MTNRERTIRCPHCDCEVDIAYTCDCGWCSECCDRDLREDPSYPYGRQIDDQP
jgi:hypothetical protein